MSFSARVFSLDCNVTLIAIDFLSFPRLSSSNKSKISTFLINSLSTLKAEVTTSSLFTFLSITKAKSLVTIWKSLKLSTGLLVVFFSVFGSSSRYNSNIFVLFLILNWFATLGCNSPKYPAITELLIFIEPDLPGSVSYTHLTLPTSDLV